jgi:hypothetical protein
MPSTVTRGPPPTTGSSTTNRTKGTSIASRAARNRGDTRAHAATSPSSAASTAYGANVPYGTSATATTKAASATSLHSGARRWTAVSIATGAWAPWAAAVTPARPRRRTAAHPGPCRPAAAR